MDIIERIPLAEVSILINRDDIRTTKNWCKEHNLKVYGPPQSYYVIKIDLELALDAEILKQFVLDYGDAAYNIYQLYKTQDYGEILKVKSIMNSANTSINYKPKSNAAKEFIKSTKTWKH